MARRLFFLDLSGLDIPFLEGITFHIGHPWYACNDSGDDTSGNIKPREDFFDYKDGWKLSGFTVDFASVDFVAIKPAASKLIAKAKALDAATIKSSFKDMTDWFKGLKAGSTPDVPGLPSLSEVKNALKNKYRATFICNYFLLCV